MSIVMSIPVSGPDTHNRYWIFEGDNSSSKKVNVDIN